MLGTTQKPAEQARPGASGRTRAISIAVGTLLAGVLLYFSLRGIEWRHAWTLIAGANVAYLAATCAMGAGTLLLRALRWRILLRAEGDVAVGTAFWATTAGYFGNSFLPARGGELVRTFMIASRSGLSNAYVLSTALFERMSDAIALVVIASLMLLTIKDPPAWFAHASRVFAILAIGGAATMAFLPRLEGLGHRILQALPISRTLQAKLRLILEHAIRGLRSFHDSRRLLLFVAFTALIWFLDAVGMTIMARALSMTMTIPVAFLLLAGLGLGSALPSTPGYLGIYQFVAVSVLTRFEFTRTDAIAYILMVQALAYVTIGCWGSIGFWQYRRMARP